MSPRCFIALDVDDGIRSACGEARRSICRLDDGLCDQKWVVKQNLHVTLAFFGDVEADCTGRLIEGLATVLDRFGPITLSQPRLTAIPSGERATMIWVAFDDPTGGFAAVAAALDRAGETLRPGRGTEADLRPRPRNRRHEPHLTLCRLRAGARVDRTVLTSSHLAFRGLEDPMSYPRATLYASRLAPQGPTYSELFVWHMRGE